MTGAIRRVRRTTVLMTLCVGLLTGISFGRIHLWHIPIWVVSAACLSSIFLIIVPRRSAVLLACLCGVVIGVARANAFLPQVLAYQSLHTREVVIIAEAANDAVYGKSGLLEFDAHDVRLEGGQKMEGKIQIGGRGVSMVYAGDVVRATGRLYVTRGSRQARISYAQLRIETQSESIVARLRREFTASILSVLPEPQASLSLGLLVGQRNTLPQDVSDQLSAVGLTHIIAVSGYNLTIIVMASRRLLGKRSKYQATAGTLVLAGLFLLVTGFSASIVRAAVVCGLSLWAWYFGRTIKPLLLILASACLTAVWSPFYIWSDLGWYLSFFAFFGVLIVAPVLQRLFFRKKEEVALLPAIALESFAAQLMTMPLIMFTFGTFSPLSLLANILVVPIIPLAMLTTLLPGVIGLINTSIAVWFVWPAKYILTYILSVTHYVSTLPLVAMHVTINARTMVFIYGCIFAIVYLLHRKQNMVQ